MSGGGEWGKWRDEIGRKWGNEIGRRGGGVLPEVRLGGEGGVGNAN